MTNKIDSDAQAIAEIVRHHIRPEILTVKGQDHFPDTEVLILPDANGGLRSHSVKKFLDEFRVAPERRVGTATMLTLDSLINHINRFKDDDSAVFANNSRDVPSLTAVFNYHRIGHDGAPRFGDHRAAYAFPLSDEWQAWVKHNGDSFSQSEFAEFLEDRIGDVEVPPDLMNAPLDDAPTKALTMMLDRLGGNLAGPGKLMELSRGLKVTAEERVHQAQNLSSGESQIQFTHEHRDEQGQPLKVPNLFLINIPVFNSGDLFRVPVRLRYRVKGGAITWSYHLHRTDQVFDAAFNDACVRVGELTGLPVFVGKPE